MIKYIYNFSNWRKLNEAVQPDNVESNTPAMEVATRIIEKAPIVKKSNDTSTVALLQTLLVKVGILKGKSGPLKNGVDGDFGGATEAALKSFIGKASISKTDEDLISTKMVEKNVTDDIVLEFFGKYEVAKKRELGIAEDQGILQPDYDRFYKPRRGFPTPSGNIEEDVIAYIYYKEGGMTDDPDDTGPAENPMPYYYDTKTKTLTANGKNIKLSSGLLPYKTESDIYPDSFKSNKWHTNRGITWEAWKGRSSGSTLDRAKKWLTVTKKEVSKKYFDSYYYPSMKDVGGKTTSQLANHFLGLVRWGSGGGGFASYLKNYLQPYLTKSGATDIKDSLIKNGERATLDMMTKARMDHYARIVKVKPEKKKYLKGWSNSFLNFHQVFVNNYAKKDIKNSDSEDKFKTKNVGGEEIVYKGTVLPEVTITANKST